MLAFHSLVMNLTRLSQFCPSLLRSFHLVCSLGVTISGESKLISYDLAGNLVCHPTFSNFV